MISITKGSIGSYKVEIKQEDIVQQTWEVMQYEEVDLESQIPVKKETHNEQFSTKQPRFLYFINRYFCDLLGEYIRIYNCSFLFMVKNARIIYVGAQKNVGSTRVTIVMIKNDLIGNAQQSTPLMFDYNIHVENKLFDLYSTCGNKRYK